LPTYVHPSQMPESPRARKDTMRPPKQFFVYIMSNGPRSASLYTGITGTLTRRVRQHKNKLVSGFTSRYNLTRLVYYEALAYPDAAIAREKEIKRWRREEKSKLIESMNGQSRAEAHISACCKLECDHEQSRYDHEH
jgi:putative endonuclease